MAAVDQHLLKVRSPVDGEEIPYHVSAPSTLPNSPIQLVFLLHDTLAEPSAGDFIEEAFRTAAQWTAALAEGPPGLLVQTWGRGNAAWFGPAGRTLFDVWNHLDGHFLLTETAALFGVGAGGTGALQLAAHFPERFHAVAAVNPWTDERLFLPLGALDHPAWEAGRRRIVRPIDLAPKLAGKTIALAHAPIGDAFTTLASGRHVAAIVDSLNRAGIPWRDFSVKQNLFSDKAADLDRSAIWRALLDSGEGKPEDRHEQPALPSSLFWRPLSIVVGTLGETSEVDVIRGLAERIWDRWSSGADSCNLAPGDRRLIQEIPIVADSEAVAETPDGDLLILGSPRQNLLAARWSDRLAISWPTSESDAFAVFGRAFANPSAFAVAHAARPDGEEGGAWIVAAGSEEAWVDVDRLRFAFLPNVFVQPKPGEILWMNHDEQ